LRADNGLTLNSSAVYTWLDGSSNGLNAIQNTVANQPLFISSNPILNQKPSIKFDGVNETLVLAEMQIVKDLIYEYNSTMNLSRTQDAIEVTDVSLSTTDFKVELKAVVPVRSCLNCGDVFLDAEADDRKQQAVLKHITPPNEVMLQWADECKLQPFEEEERPW
jgi:hypothetical protein